MNKETINKLVARCIDYTLYMGELYFTDEERERLHNKLEKLKENSKQ